MNLRKLQIFKNTVVCISILLVLIKYGQYIQKCEKECVAYYIGAELEAIYFQEEVYFLNDDYVYEHWNKETKQYCGNVQSQALYRCKDRKIKSLAGYVHYLIVTKLWVDESDEEYTHVQISGGVHGAYSKSSFLENEKRVKHILDKVSNYIIVSKEQPGERNCSLAKDILVELESKFGECVYFVDDFFSMKEAFYVYVNSYFPNDGLQDTGDYVATIFMDEEGTLYYCNSNNVIEGALAEEIKEVLEVGDMLKE